MLDDYLKNPDSFIFGDSSKPRIRTDKIYRYISYDRLCDILRKGKMSYSLISSWEDVYENWFLKAHIVNDNWEMNYSKYQNVFYGMCWTFEPASDALWRIYSENKNGIRIKSTVDKVLQETIKHYENSINLERIYSGIVKYYKLIELKKIIKGISPQAAMQLPKNIAMNSLFQKREAFSHEKEFRFIVMMKKVLRKKYIEFPINLNEVIETIMFDPRIDNTIFEQRKRELKKLGFAHTIRKSSLYTFDNIVIG